MNIAVVHEEGVSKPGKTFAGFIIRHSNGFLGQVSACHHQRNGEAADAFQQEVMQRCIWQHDAKPVLSGGRFGDS